MPSGKDYTTIPTKYSQMPWRQNLKLSQTYSGKEPIF